MVGFCECYPSTKFLYIQVNAAYIAVGHYDEMKTPFTLYEFGTYKENSNRYLEAITSKGLLNQYDELGIEELANFYLKEQNKCRVNDLYDLMKMKEEEFKRRREEE